MIYDIISLFSLSLFKNLYYIIKKTYGYYLHRFFLLW